MGDCRCCCRCDRYFVTGAERELYLSFGSFDCISTVSYSICLVRMRAAVICPFAVGRLYLKLFRALSNCESSDCFGYSVVGRRNIAPCNLVGVVAAVYFGLRSGDFDADAVCSGQRYCYCCACRERCSRLTECRCAVLSKRCAVIFFISAFGYYRKRCRCDRQCTRFI